jgi:hypothetical protein
MVLEYKRKKRIMSHANPSASKQWLLNVYY